MVRSLFVTSPTRGAGKTLVALALVRALRRRGQRAVGIKPVDTGCAPGPDHDLLSIDGRYLQTASGPPDVPYTVIAPYRLGSGLSPGLALAELGLELSTRDLARAIDDAAEWGELVIVEGPWTASAPLSSDGVTLDLAAAAQSWVVLVVADGPGAVAEAEEVLASVRARGLTLRGVVLSAGALGAGAAAQDPRVPAASAARAAELEARVGVPVVVLGPLAGDLEARVTAAEQALEPWAWAPFADPRPS